MLSANEAKTNIFRILECINTGKNFHFEEHPPGGRRWAKLYVTRTFPACSPVQLMFTEYLESSTEWHMQEPTQHQARTRLTTNEVPDHQLADNKEENHIQTYHIFLQEYRQQCEVGEGWSLQHRRSLLSTLSRSLSPEKQPHYSDSYVQPHRQLYKPDRRSFQSRGRLEWK